MSAGDTTLGRRLPDQAGSPGKGGPICEMGDYYRDADGEWWCTPPAPGVSMGRLTDHTITEHDDGTITVSPSILMPGHHSWHGYLERGVWREV